MFIFSFQSKWSREGTNTSLLPSDGTKKPIATRITNTQEISVFHTLSKNSERTANIRKQDAWKKLMSSADWMRIKSEHGGWSKGIDAITWHL
jgi:hypothetical protein